MTDLTKITTPFGLLDPETQEALREWENGVEVYKGDLGWVYIDPWFDLDCTYRARPAPLTPDSIDWSHVAPEWKWMARDQCGMAYIYTSKPYHSNMSWNYDDEGQHASIEGVLSSYRRGTVEWQDSLVERPE